MKEIVLTQEEIENFYNQEIICDKMKDIGATWTFDDDSYADGMNNDFDSDEGFSVTIYNEETDQSFTYWGGNTYTTPVGGHHFYDETLTFKKD